MRFVHVNAPEADSLALGRIICQNAACGPWVLDAYSVPMRERCHAAFALIDSTTGKTAPFYAFEGQLDVPLPMLEGMTPRAAYRAFTRWVEQVTADPATPGRWAAERVKVFLGLVRRSSQGRDPSVCFHDAGQASRAHVLCMVERFPKDEHVVIEAGSSPELPDVFSRVVRIPGGLDASHAEAALRDKAAFLFVEVPPERKIEVVQEVPK